MFRMKVGRLRALLSDFHDDAEIEILSDQTELWEILSVYSEHQSMEDRLVCIDIELAEDEPAVDVMPRDATAVARVVRDESQ